MIMKKTAIGLSLAALVLSSGAIAAPGARTAKADADGNGTITRAEAQSNATATFARLDANKDGKLDQADRAARMEAMKARRFDRLDTDKNGQISRAEFTAERPRREGAREGRRGYGKPGSARMGAHGGMMRGGAAMDQAQFVASAMQRFDAMDANKDGQVTTAERQAVREQRRAQRQQARAATPQS